MKKILIFAFVMILLIVSVFAASSAAGTSVGGVGSEVSGFINDFVKKRGIDNNSVKDIKKVDFNSLPKDVNIKNVGDSNLAIYQVDYNNGSETNQVYVISYSVEQLRSQGDLIVAQDNRAFLDFGHSGVMGETGFLETSVGVETSQAKGYVMPRDGSITAVSTNLEVVQANTGQIEIVVLKNGNSVSFGNTLSTEFIGVKKDYDVQSKDTVTFRAGDVISVLAKKTGEVSWRDVITEIEITTTS